MYIVMIWWLQNRKRIEAADWGEPRGASLATVSASWCRSLRSEPSANWCRAKRLWAKWENYTFRGGISCSCWGAAAITSAWRRGRLALYVWRPRETSRYTAQKLLIFSSSFTFPFHPIYSAEPISFSLFKLPRSSENYNWFNRFGFWKKGILPFFLHCFPSELTFIYTTSADAFSSLADLFFPPTIC